jgi:DNA uptake protein ComE-like DNA-binding protein
MRTLRRGEWIGLTTALVLTWSFAAIGQGGAPQQSSDGLPDGPGKSEVVRICGECHSATRATTLRLTREGWAGVIDDMVKAGATGTDKELKAVLNYVSSHFAGEAARAINLNTAPSIDLESVVGLLRSEAKALIAWREKTPCKKIDDLKNVPGLDFKKIEAARERIGCF